MITYKHYFAVRNSAFLYLDFHIENNGDICYNKLNTLCSLRGDIYAQNCFVR